MDRVVCISKAIRDLEREISDLEWDGKPADHLASRLALMKERRTNGELWEISF